MNRKHILFIVSVVFFAFILQAPAYSQEITAERVLDNMIKHYHDGIKDINDYVVVSEGYTVYHKKIIVDGWPSFKTRVEPEGDGPPGGMIPDGLARGHAVMFNKQVFERMKAAAEYGGVEQVNDFGAHVIKLDKVEELFTESPGEMKNMRMYIDSENWFLRQVKFELYGDRTFIQLFGSSLELTEMMKDYRNIQGMMMPFETVLVVEGLSDMRLPDAMLEEIRRELEAMEKLPPQQQEMFKSKIEQMKNLLESERLEFAFRVKDVKVNTGLKDDIFDLMPWEALPGQTILPGSSGEKLLDKTDPVKPLAKVKTKWTSPATSMEFVWIPQMKMWVGKYEVTNAEYRKKEPGHDSGEYKGHTLNRDRQPVVQVNFNDAKTYAEWMTERDRGVLPEGYKYRLPSEAEWLTYAQCGDGREYPWGNNWPPKSGQAGNYHGREGAGEWEKIPGYNDGFPVTAPVDELWKNPWGLAGVGGNVWEVCASDSTGESFETWRGASWHNNRHPLKGRCQETKLAPCLKTSFQS